MNLITKIKSLRHEMYLGFCHMMPLRRNKIILWSDNFKTFGCSPKYIALDLAEKCADNLDIVWILEHDRPIPQNIPEGIRIVRYFSMEYLKEISTAKVIVCNARTSNYHFFPKRQGQYYIQTWHSSLRLKMIEGDASNLPEAYVETAKQDSQKIDLLLSGCQFSTDIFRRAFWYDGEILESGTPRCDIFFQDPKVIRSKVFQFFGIPEEKKLALYAPTFRKDGTDFLCGMNLDQLSTSLGKDWCIGCRLHPNLNAEIPEGIAIPMSKYPDMQELLVACDLLITDYSSSMFDMAVAKKRCILYVPDLENYTASERGLYFDIAKLPFPIAHTMDELINHIQHFDVPAYHDQLSVFLSEIGSFETGRAASAVRNVICRVCGLLP